MFPSRRYQQTLNRQQKMLLPSSVDEYVSQNNTVRAIDAYVNTLNLQALGFKHSAVILTAGQPPYNPIRANLASIVRGKSRIGMAILTVLS